MRIRKFLDLPDPDRLKFVLTGSFLGLAKTDKSWISTVYWLATLSEYGCKKAFKYQKSIIYFKIILKATGGKSRIRIGRSVSGSADPYPY
jgi:hypothetical protein